MRKLLLSVALAASVAGSAGAQDATPEFLISRDAPGLKVSWVDFGWNPEAFAAMEAGTAHRAASREWMLAMLRVYDPVRLEGAIVRVGASLLVLVPKRGDEPMKLELRDVDVRDMMWKPDVIGLPPEKFELIKSIPARWGTVPETAERLTMALTPEGRDTRLTIHYGNRRAELVLTPRQ